MRPCAVPLGDVHRTPIFRMHIGSDMHRKVTFSIHIMPAFPAASGGVAKRVPGTVLKTETGRTIYTPPWTSAAALPQLVDLGAVVADRGLERVDPALEQFDQFREPAVQLRFEPGEAFPDGGDSGEDVLVQDADALVGSIESLADSVEVLVDPVKSLVSLALPLFEPIESPVRVRMPVVDLVEPFVGLPLPPLDSIETLVRHDRLRPRVDDDTSSHGVMEEQSVCREESGRISPRSPQSWQDLPADARAGGADSAMRASTALAH